jgi:hypothetical protein
MAQLTLRNQAKAAISHHRHELHAKSPAHDLVGVALVELTALGEGGDPEQQDAQHDKAGHGGEQEQRIGKHGLSPFVPDLGPHSRKAKAKKTRQPLAISQSSARVGSTRRKAPIR